MGDPEFFMEQSSLRSFSAAIGAKHKNVHAEYSLYGLCCHSRADVNPVFSKSSGFPLYPVKRGLVRAQESKWWLFQWSRLVYITALVFWQS
jgi:hypothetical protein